MRGWPEWRGGPDVLRAVVWAALLAVGVTFWLASPSIGIADRSGNGCGQWNMRELGIHRDQLVACFLVPLAVAQLVILPILARHRLGIPFVLFATGGVVWVIAALWQPANIYIVYAQLLMFIVLPAITAAVPGAGYLAVAYDRQPAPRGRMLLLALGPPVVLIGLFSATRLPWVWTC